MVIRYLLVLVVALTVTACSHKYAQDNGLGLKAQYDQYMEFLKTRYKFDDEVAFLKQAQQYYSEAKWLQVSAVDEGFVTAAEVASKPHEAIYFPNEMIRYIDAKEEIDFPLGCLFVEGINENKEPIVFFISYIYEHNKWLIDEIEISYFTDGTTPYVKEPICDIEEKHRLWLKQFE